MKIKISDQIEVAHTSVNVMSVYVSGVESGFELPVLLRADAHHDSPFCNRSLEKEHLDSVCEEGGLILDFGDIFDGINGRYDPRKSYDGLRPEYKVDNYFDAIITDADKFYAPYAKNWLLMGRGNHESTVLKHNGIDLTSNLVHRMNSDHGGHIQCGGFGGYVRFLFDSGKHISKTIKYFHGTRGNSNMNSIQRQATIYPDADVIVNGDSHNAWYVPISRERISQRGVVERDIQHHIRTASYQDNYRDGSGGWWVEDSGKPQVQGAVWLWFYFKNHKIEISVEQVVR